MVPILIDTLYETEFVGVLLVLNPSIFADSDIILEEVKLVDVLAVGRGDPVAAAFKSPVQAVGAQMDGVLEVAGGAEPLEAKVALGFAPLSVPFYHGSLSIC